MALCAAVSVCTPHWCALSLPGMPCVGPAFPAPFLFDCPFSVCTYVCRFRDFPDVWILSKLPGDVVRKLEAVIRRELKQLQVQHEEVVQSGTYHIDSVSLEKLQNGLIFMTCLSGYVRGSAAPFCAYKVEGVSVLHA